MELLVCFTARKGRDKGNFDAVITIGNVVTSKMIDLIRVELIGSGYESVVFTSIFRLDE